MHEWHRRNPFQEVYVSEALEDPELYWSWFSPEILSGEAGSLYRRGNVVLKGSNGTGKTMLLRLFSTEVQAAYVNHGSSVPSHDSIEYISIGINFIHAGFGALGNRVLGCSQEENLQRWPLLVGDMLNYFLMFELLRTLQLLSDAPGQRLAADLEVKVDKDTLDEFAVSLASNPCWFGALEGCSSFNSLSVAVRKRLTEYRAFLNLNYETLPASIQSTKTEIGEPLSQAKSAMDIAGVIKKKIALMVTIDQFETLLHTDYATTAGEVGPLGRAFCRVVNSLLARRDPKVSYKVGVRPYSWGKELRVLGSDARLERGRDYQIVDLDEILRRKENTGAWLFPRFARDVARRRMAQYGADVGTGDWLENHLEQLTLEEELRRYCGREPMRLLPDDPSWPRQWRDGLRRLYESNKYEALMAAVWTSQELGRGQELPSKLPGREKAPWVRDWWQKERRDTVLMQAASRCKQRRLYGGWNQLMTLSGSNILVFLSLCREMWDIWERSTNDRMAGDKTISVEIQSQAIRVVSSSWLTKLDEFPGGPRRRSFVTRLGIGIRRALLTDIGLVYPGRNGFSLLQQEYESSRADEVRAFLDEAADFGALLALPHTTKEKSRSPRVKWYLLPVLCPMFDTPAVRTKEPYYASLSEVIAWVPENAAIDFKPPRGGRSRQNMRSDAHQDGAVQTSLFPPTEKKE